MTHKVFHRTQEIPPLLSSSLHTQTQKPSWFTGVNNIITRL